MIFILNFFKLEDEKKKSEPIVNNAGLHFERKLSQTSAQPISNRLPSKTQTQLPNITKIISDFKSLIDQMIEAIVNLETSAINYSNLDKNMKILLNPANYENVPVPEIVEKDIGKYLYTIVNLMEALENAYEKSNVRLTLANVKSIFKAFINVLIYKMKEYKGQLNHILRDMKTQLISHVVYNLLLFIK